ncbi:MAG: hypothetical protein KatS3mg083_108 [Candidatus Dojkabacteria bacterium]|nr:MAG: hypothetical protein KatS3mg083_108 [Candidatus Dojkabacteria bacterium]
MMMERSFNSGASAVDYSANGMDNSVHKSDNIWYFVLLTAQSLYYNIIYISDSKFINGIIRLLTLASMILGIYKIIREIIYNNKKAKNKSRNI